MAVYNVELRRSNGSNYEDKIYLKTSVGLVEGLLDENDKIRASLLPSFVFGGMRFVTTIDDDTDLATLHNYFNTFVTNNGGLIRGCYAIVSSGPQVITISEGYEIWVEEDAGTSETSGQVTVEVNDWLICISDDGKTWAIINNTYRDATTSFKGIVKLATEQDGINGTSTTLAMTPKSTVAAINARAYSHPTYLTETFYSSGARTVITQLQMENGHIKNLSSASIPSADESQTGLIQLASSSEAKAATEYTKATSPLRVKEMIDKFASIELVQSLPTDMSDHPAGKLIMLQL